MSVFCLGAAADETAAHEKLRPEPWMGRAQPIQKLVDRFSIVPRNLKNEGCAP
jgi:hypothetical protein